MQISITVIRGSELKMKKKLTFWYARVRNQPQNGYFISAFALCLVFFSFVLIKGTKFEQSFEFLMFFSYLGFFFFKYRVESEIYPSYYEHMSELN